MFYVVKYTNTEEGIYSNINIDEKPIVHPDVLKLPYQEEINILSIKEIGDQVIYTGWFESEDSCREWIDLNKETLPELLDNLNVYKEIEEFNNED